MREECRSHRPTAPFGRGRPFTQGSTLPETYPISIYLYALSNLVSSLIFIGLAIFVLLRGTSQSANKLFALWCFSVSVWAFGVYKQTLAADAASAWFWSRLLHASAAIIPVLFAHFILAYLNSVNKHLITSLYVLGTGFSYLALYPGDILIREVSPITLFPFYPKAGRVYPFFLAFFCSCVMLGLYKLLKAYAIAPAIQRNQIRYLMLAMIIGFGGGTTAFFHVFDIPVFPYGNYGLVAACAAIISYAMVKYRLMDISIVINKGLAYSLLLCVIFIPSYLAIAVSHRATLYSIPPLLAGTIIFASGLWTVFKNPRATTNRLFGLLCLSLCFWLFGIFMVYSTTDETEALFWQKFIYVGVVFIPAVFSQFCSNFLRSKRDNKLPLLNYFISALFALLIPTSYLIDEHYKFFWGYYPRAGLLHPLFLVYFLWVISLSLRKLYRGYQANEGQSELEATRIKFVFLAFTVGYAASIDFLQSYGIEFYPMGYIFVTLMAVVLSYSILKHHLMDIAAIETRARALPYGYVLVLILSYIVVLMLIRLFTGSMQFVLTGILVALFLIFSGILVDFQKMMAKAVATGLFRKTHDAYETLSAFSKALVKILDLKTLIEEIERTLVTVLGVETATLYLFNKERNVYAPVSTYGPGPSSGACIRLAADAELPRHLAMGQAILVREEMEHFSGTEEKRTLIDALRRVKADVCIPFVNKNALIGFCVLGPRTTRQMYSDQDLSLLTMLAQAAAIALDNAALYEELKHSRSLVQRTDRLRSLETIAGGFAHEVRNPLTSIKTFIQLTPERKDDPEFIGHFSTVVAEDVARIERLIQEILDYARYMQPKFQEDDINVIVESCLYFIRIKADSKGVWLKKDLTSDLPPALLDRQQIKQVLLNLFINAIEAMGDHGGQLIVRTHRLSKAPGDTWAQIEVTDTGCGIPPADLEHIFDPFYTTKHESKEHEGTGLGLTIVHQIVQEHGGHIEVKSEFGRGTTFLVNLPACPARVLEAPIETRGV